MRRALIIANEVYHDSRYATLPGAVADANALEEVLRDPAIGAFEVTVLRDAGLRTISLAVADHFDQGGPDDVLLLHISAHGVKDAHGHLFFVASDSSSETHRLRPTALSASDIRDEMADSRARRIIVLLDCCYSGAFVSEERSRGVDAADLTRPFRGRGHVVITACTAAQLAWERGGQGIFTRAVVEALRTGAADRNGDGIVDTDELHRYIVDTVRGESPRQTPTLSAWNVEGILQIARNPRYVPPRTPGPDSDPRPVPLQGERQRPGLARRLRQATTVGLAHLRMLYRRTRDLPVTIPPRRVAASVLAIWAVLLGLGTYADASGYFPGCPQPTVVRVATSSAGYLTYREVADAYERWTAGRTGGCPSARLFLYPAHGDRIREVIGSGPPAPNDPWQRRQVEERYVEEVGPHPDLWLPESLSDAERAEAATAEAGPALTTTRFASTPLVLGVPGDRMDPDGRDAGLRSMVLTWRDLFARATRPADPPVLGGSAGTAWGVVRADPTTSAAARLGTLALYRDDTAQDGLISAFDARREVERWLDSSLDAHVYPIGEEPALLCRHRSLLGTTTPRPTRVPAVILSEQALVRFNQGQPLGAGCETHRPPPEGRELQAFYPLDSPVLVASVVQLSWRDTVQDERVRTAAGEFVDWLTGTGAGKQALLQVGLRPDGYEVAAPIDTSNGALPDWPFSQSRSPEGDDAARPVYSVGRQEEARKRYAAAHRPGRILVALDASGSMRQPTEDPSLTRFEVALAGVREALGQMSTGDEFGLLTFSTAPANSRQVVPIGPRSAAQVRSLRATPEQLQPSGDTPLYAAIRRGHELLVAGPEGPLLALVVLTDGQDTTGTAAPMVAQLRGVRIYFVAVGGAACAGSVLDRIAQGTGGNCLGTGPDTVDDVFATLFEALWTGGPNAAE